MSPVWIMTLALAAPPYEGTLPVAPETSPSAVVKAAEPAPLTGRELQEAVRDALQNWVRPDDAEADRAALQLLALHEQLRRDTELAQSQRSLLVRKVRNRLERLKGQIARRIAREETEGLDKLPVTMADVRGRLPVLAQMMGRGGMGFGGMGGMPMGGMGGGMGGWGGAGGFGGGPRHMGEELVELIQTTIAPDSWEVNGGPGTIQYWRNGMSLIIRQTDEVHGEIDDLLRQLERTNR